MGQISGAPAECRPLAAMDQTAVHEAGHALAVWLARRFSPAFSFQYATNDAASHPGDAEMMQADRGPRAHVMGFVRRDSLVPTLRMPMPEAVQGEQAAVLSAFLDSIRGELWVSLGGYAADAKAASERGEGGGDEEDADPLMVAILTSGPSDMSAATIQAANLTDSDALAGQHVETELDTLRGLFEGQATAAALAAVARAIEERGTLSWDGFVSIVKPLVADPAGQII